ncbi:9593_t:CDS:2, partial [Ambispora leptoticha]
YDGSGFVMAYLFVEGNKQDGARTEILADFFKRLHNLGMNKLVYLYTDKDFAQISAARQIWINIKVQICYWHFKKALKKRLVDNSQPKRITYSSYDAHNSFNFIDIKFYPTELPKSNFCFCPKNLRPKVISIMEHHMHLHPLIPNLEGIFSTKDEIWTQCTKEMYEFCVTNDLKYLWSYLWTNWYRNELWQLWVRSAISDRICVFRTTMLVESHWKVIKRNFLQKFFRPRLDLVTYIITSRLIPHQEQQYYKYFNKREIPSWRKNFKREWISLKKKEINNTYITDIDKWFCNSFYHSVQRQDIYPFIYLPGQQTSTQPSVGTTLSLSNTLNNSLS